MVKGIVVEDKEKVSESSVSIKQIMFLKFVDSKIPNWSPSIFKILQIS